MVDCKRFYVSRVDHGIQKFSYLWTTGRIIWVRLLSGEKRDLSQSQNWLCGSPSLVPIFFLADYILTHYVLWWIAKDFMSLEWITEAKSSATYGLQEESSGFVCCQGKKRSFSESKLALWPAQPRTQYPHSLFTPRCITADSAALAASPIYCELRSTCFSPMYSWFTHHITSDAFSNSVHCRTVQHTDTNKDPIYAATPPPY